jgi:ribosome-binding protein aMBF1 (putative translation factor)
VRTTVVYGRPCDNCGHQRETVYVGLPDDVAALLRAAFEQSGLSKAELCRRVGLSTHGSYLNKLFDGTSRPSMPVARDLITVLEMIWVDGQRLLAASGTERDRRSRRVA